MRTSISYARPWGKLRKVGIDDAKSGPNIIARTAHACIRHLDLKRPYGKCLLCNFY